MTETDTKTQAAPKRKEPTAKNQKDYTPEEMKQMRDNMVKHYKGEITFLKVQAQYELLLADIEEAKTRRYVAMAHTAQLFAGVEEEQEKRTANKTTQGRKLKMD